MSFWWTSIKCFHDNIGVSRAPWLVENVISSWEDVGVPTLFAGFCNRYTLDVDSQDSQEYEDVESSQIYVPGLDETQIVMYLFSTLCFRSATKTRFYSS